MENKFKFHEGMIVKLKSGGVPMLVTSSGFPPVIGSHPYEQLEVTCVMWHDSIGCLHRDQILAHFLVEDREGVTR